MKILCDKCEYVIDKDKYFDGVLVEEYINIYGTYCPNCGNFVPPKEPPLSNKEKKIEMEILRDEMRKKLRKNI